MNTVNLIGRLTRENEIKYSQSGTAVLRNSVAVNRKFKREETDFINILAFGKTAELIANHMNKGDQLGIEGRIQSGSYEKDGRRVYTFDVIVDNITFLSNKGGEQNNQQGNRQPEPRYNADPGDPFKGDSTEIDSDSLPF